MPDPVRIPHKLDREAATVRAIIETPRGRRTKFDYDPETGLYIQAGLVPEGMSFPLDFGFIPSTKAEDGDPLDVLVLNDEAAPVGTLLSVRLLGVIEAEQTETDGETVRNDRLIAVADTSLLYARIKGVEDLEDKFIDDLTQFFVNYNDLKGKRFNVLRVAGPEAAAKAVEDAAV